MAGGKKREKKCTVNASDISRITINQIEKNEQAVITLRHLRLISIFKKIKEVKKKIETRSVQSRGFLI